MGPGPEPPSTEGAERTQTGGEKENKTERKRNERGEDVMQRERKKRGSGHPAALKWIKVIRLRRVISVAPLKADSLNHLV